MFELYSRPTAKTYKTFLATWRPAGGVLRVVLVQENIKLLKNVGATKEAMSLAVAEGPNMIEHVYFLLDEMKNR